jgi:hypothetical protein
MKNGNYMKQEFNGSLELIKIVPVDNPIDSDLLKERHTAERVLEELLSGNTNIIVLYDEDNPPEKVIELKINYEEIGQFE